MKNQMSLADNQQAEGPPRQLEQQTDLIMVFNNTEQLRNIIYEDADNENMPSRLSNDNQSKLTSEQSPTKEARRLEASVNSKETSNFQVVRQQHQPRKASNLLEAITEGNLPTYDAERDEILIDLANQNSPEGSDKLDETVLNTEKRHQLGIFRKVTSEVMSSSDSPRQVGLQLSGQCEARAGLDHNSLLEQIGLRN